MLKRCSLLICFALALPVAALADQEGGTFQYTMETADKKYIFVMLRGCDYDKNVHFYTSEKYPESGLYLNDGSRAPLWTVEWCGNVFLPSDGIHVVRMGPWPRTREGSSVEAITFFASGKLLKSYRIGDLVTIPWLLEHSSSHYRWQRLITPEEGAQSFSINIIEGGSYPAGSGVVFDESAHTMEIATLQGDAYLFDLDTGEIVSARRPVRTITISLLAFFVLFYAWYLMRATARPRLPLRKLYQRLAFNALVMAWLVALLGVGLFTAAMHSQSETPRSLLYIGVLRVFVEAPMEIAWRNEWVWARPFATFHPYYRALGVLYLLCFWYAIFAGGLMTNSTLATCLRSARQRCTSGLWTKSSGTGLSTEGMSYTAPMSTKKRRFREVQHFSRFWLGLLAFFLSVWAALGVSEELEAPDILADPAPILIFALIGVLLPAFFLNVKMVTQVGDNGVVVGLRLLWLQTKRIAFADIRHCSIQPRHSHEQDELLVHRYAVWAPLGVLIELMEGDWILIGSQRPQELLEAIRLGQHKAKPD